MSATKTRNNVIQFKMQLFTMFEPSHDSCHRAGKRYVHSFSKVGMEERKPSVFSTNSLSFLV